MDAYLFAGRNAAGGQQFLRREQHARRAKSALQRVAGDERLLQIGDLFGIGHALDGLDVRTTAPSTRTLQAPHTPCSQPTWLPVSPTSSRRKSTSVLRASTVAGVSSPFTVTTMSWKRAFMVAPAR